jgi:hypothetical protein
MDDKHFKKLVSAPLKHQRSKEINKISLQPSGPFIRSRLIREFSLKTSHTHFPQLEDGRLLHKQR